MKGAGRLDILNQVILKGNIVTSPGVLIDGLPAHMLRQDPSSVIVSIKDKRSIFICPIYSWRSRLVERLNLHFSKVAYGILGAMVLGYKENIPLLLYQSMVRSGTVHVLVVSGFNVGLVAFFFDLILKILRLRRRIRIIVILPVIFLYCALTGCSNPVLRATVMGSLAIIALLCKREPDMCNLLALAFLIIIFIDPWQLFDVGFQLSFASVLGIIFAAQKLNCITGANGRKPGIFKLIFETAAVSFSAWLFTAPIIFFNFKSLSLISVLANIIIVPLAALITVSGFVFLLFSFAGADFMAYKLATSIEIAVFIFAKIVIYLGNLSWATLSFNL
jgi:competence protein ComEC